MRKRLTLAAVFLVLAAPLPPIAAAQDVSFQEMRWRDSGPTRGGVNSWLTFRSCSSAT